MSNRTRARKRFWRSVFRLFALYALLLPLVFFLLDRPLFISLAKDDIALFCVELLGIALVISLVINLWSHRDPELQKW